MTNSEDPDQSAYILMVYNTFKNLHNILREKYFYMVSEG